MIQTIETFDALIRALEQADTVLASGPLSVHVAMGSYERATFLRILAIWLRGENQGAQVVAAEYGSSGQVYIRSHRPSRFLDYIPWPASTAEQDRLADLARAASRRILWGEE